MNKVRMPKESIDKLAPSKYTLELEPHDIITINGIQYYVGMGSGWFSLYEIEELRPDAGILIKSMVNREGLL